MLNLKILKNRLFKIIIAILSVIIVTAAAFIVVKASPTYVSDSFTDETKIGKGTEIVKIDTSAGQVKLAECYTATPSWSKSDDTIVRDIENDYNVTVNKDIYCDNNNCILYTDGGTPPAQICIATDADVYVNILWSKADVSGTKTWGPSSSIAGGDIGGAHAAGLKVGNGGTSVGTKNWLERYYTSSPGTYVAMDECKAKGSGWRLPTILELDSIRDQAKAGAPYSRLPGIVSYSYWSSTDYLASSAYTLYFSTGSVSSYDKTYSNYVRCVRGQ